MSGVNFNTWRETEEIWVILRAFLVWVFLSTSLNKSMFTIDSKDIFDLFLYDLQSHLNSICLRHGVHLIGVQSVDVQDLEENK